MNPEKNNYKGLGVKFRGLIACGRYFNRRINAKYVRKTFITIGYDNGKFVDLVIDSYARFTDYLIISGFGHIRNYLKADSSNTKNYVINLESNGLTLEVEAFNLE